MLFYRFLIMPVLNLTWLNLFMYAYFFITTQKDKNGICGTSVSLSQDGITVDLQCTVIKI